MNSENKPLAGMYVCMKSKNKSYLAGMGGRVAIRSSDFRSVVKKKGCMVRPYRFA